VKKVDYFLQWSAPFVGGIGLASDAFAPQILAIDVPFAQRLDGIQFLCGAARGLNHGSNTDPLLHSDEACSFGGIFKRKFLVSLGVSFGEKISVIR
jgi:hypothetical protein